MRKSKAVRSLDHTEPILFEADVHIARDRVVLRLCRHTNAPLLLRRDLVRFDSSVFGQNLLLEEDETLAEFAAADPYREHLRAQYQSIEREIEEQSQHGWLATHSTELDVDPVTLIGEIQKCANEAQLIALSRRIVSQLGGHSFVFQCLWADEKNDAVREQHCLIGCDPTWMHRYISSLWYLDDPFLEYAKRHTAPVTGAQVDVDGDDHWARRDATEYGFRSTLICPARSSTAAVVGALQIGTRQPQNNGEEALWQKRVLFRSLAAELLDWYIEAIRHKASDSFSLDPRDKHVLRILKAGGTALNVAHALGVSERTVYAIYHKINEKLGVQHIAKAVTAAAAAGLI